MSFVPYDKKEEQTTMGMPTIQPSGTDEEDDKITRDRDMEIEPAWTSKRVPPSEFSVFEEAAPTRDMSRIVYTLTDLLDKEKITLKLPEDFPFPNFGQNKESIDLTGGGRQGMSFYEMDQIIKENRDAIYENGIPEGQDIETVKRLRKGLGDENLKKIFFTHHRYMQREIACVYSIVKDTIQKRIIVTFRGSQSGNRDWPTNVRVLSEKMLTPDRIKGLLDGKLQDHVLVHKGFFDYLFNNDLIKGNQRYDSIIEDIRKNLQGEEGYSIYVTGHSLGGALATVFSVKLAGAGHKFDDIPRPLTCITWAAPHQGTAGYRTIVETLEKQGYLRLLRIFNDEDIVPAVCGFLFFRPRQLKHVGIGLRMYYGTGKYQLEHSSRANFRTFLRNLIFKPIWKLLDWHGLTLHHERFFNGEEKWENTKLDDLYKDETIVSPEFLAGKTW